MAYTAPDIKDRVATGDDQFISEDMGDSKVRLTPAPDEVVEAGTDINKALLQPLCDTVEKIDNQTVPVVNDLSPYNLYYWLSRGISGYYSEVQDLAWNHSDCYSYHSSSSPTRRKVYIMYLFLYTESYDKTTCTIKYSSKINISQSDGVITLANPSTVTFNDSQSSTTIENTLAGKYITGINPNSNQVFYVPTSNSIETENWYTSGDFSTYRNYKGYTWNVYNNESLSEGSGTKIMYISSKYNSTNTPWGVISSTEPDTYPASGTVDGTEYIRLGRIDEAFLNYAVKNPTAFQNIATFEARLSALESAISGI